MNLINLFTSNVNICIYPYNAEFLPVLEHADLLIKECNISLLVSPKGWNIKQKIKLNNKVLPILDFFDFETCKIDYILIPEFSELVRNKIVEQKIISYIYPILKKIRGVILSAKLDDQNYKELKFRCENVCEFINLNDIAYDTFNFNMEWGNDIKNINVPVITIMGMWEGTDKFDVSLSVRELFQNDGYHVTQIGSRNYCELLNFHSFPRFMFEPTIDEVKKIIYFNRFIKDLVNSENPDVVIISIPGSIQQYNKIITNRFGVLPFLISKAILIDFLILCMTYEPDAENLFEMIATSCIYKYGRKADILHMSRTMVDGAKTKETNIFSTNRIFEKMVNQSINNKYLNLSIPIVNARNEHGKNILYKTLMNKLADNVTEIIN